MATGKRTKHYTQKTKCSGTIANLEKAEIQSWTPNIIIKSRGQKCVFKLTNDLFVRFENPFPHFPTLS